MTDIQRWDIDYDPQDGVHFAAKYDGTGRFVLYSDHVEALLAQQNEFGVTLNDALRQAEQRAYDDRNVYSEAEVEEQNTKHYDKGRVEGYEQGQRDALAAAVQQVEALEFYATYEPLIPRSNVLAALRGLWEQA